jgi:helicase required for RNAi-mediated heterochromatin assembly 1
MAARVQFSHERAGKRIRWSQSKRLQQGSIVALTTPSDKFNTICKIAVVASRSLTGVIKNPSEVDLFWGDPNEATFDSTEQYVMIEARDGYFEANRHMLVALQKLMFET